MRVKIHHYFFLIQLKSGDLVKMNVYSDKRVEFFVNGESQGVCFTLDELPVIPVCTVSCDIDLEIINFYSLDEDTIPDETSMDLRDTIPQNKQSDYKSFRNIYTQYDHFQNNN
eukprot:TRINITY_DN568_c0_g1_i3.p1 TRINITY_DN568_c0_g1~~TRINITY_DN568_c0_g1_i3.p1  ORF type:complete len:113 (+),score=8.83 TRINITY_DN568_c0_g1_i3:3-341(+)